MRISRIDRLQGQLQSLSLSLSLGPSPQNALLPCSSHLPLRAPPARRASPAQRRSHQTAARTKRALRVAPHHSFLLHPSSKNPGAPAQDHIIFNPPSSAATVHHTPFKFLPANDPRRANNLQRLFSRGSDAARGVTSSGGGGGGGGGGGDGTAAKLPPAIEPLPEEKPPKKYHLTKEDVKEMRRLRRSDPKRWTISALAKKFDCSKNFVGFCAPAGKKYHRELEAELDSIKQRWGPRRAAARLDREKRRKMLYNGQL